MIASFSSEAFRRSGTLTFSQDTATCATNAVAIVVSFSYCPDETEYAAVAENFRKACFEEFKLFSEPYVERLPFVRPISDRKLRQEPIDPFPRKVTNEIRGPPVAAIAL